MVLIGFLAKKGAGKDTCGDYLVANHKFKKMSFAGPLKEGCRAMFGFNDEQLHGSLKEVTDPNWGVSPRKVLQFIGTDLVRNQMAQLIPNVGTNFWTTCFKIGYLKELQLDPNCNIVVTDVRFQNEVDIITSLGGMVIKIIRPDSKYGADTHPSEDIDCVNGFTYTLSNSSTVDSLYQNLESVIKVEAFFGSSNNNQ